MPTKSEKEASSKGEPLPVTRGHSLQDAVEIEELDYDLFKSKVNRRNFWFEKIH